jgi:hypothetical protein
MVTAAVVVMSLASAGPAGAELNAVASARVANNTLIIFGTRGDDVVLVTQSADTNQLLVDVNGDNTFEQFDRSTFTAVDVVLGDGNDVFQEAPGIVSDEKLTIQAGAGDDQLLTGDGSDLILADSGNDFVSSGKGDDLIIGGLGDDFADGGPGTDIALLGVGKDTFQWDPGEGSDVIDGGLGEADVMLFNGGNGGDTASLSANGHRSLFLRDPGNIRMDMDGVETVQFNALGGTDTMTVNDMRGTDIRRADINVGVLGGADGVLDTVTVNATEQGDHVRATGDGTTVDVAGLRAETTITGADVRDQLHINTGDGNDAVNVDGSATALIGVTSDLGAGQH